MDRVTTTTATGVPTTFVATTTTDVGAASKSDGGSGFNDQDKQAAENILELAIGELCGKLSKSIADISKGHWKEIQALALENEMEYGQRIDITDTNTDAMSKEEEEEEEEEVV